MNRYLYLASPYTHADPEVRRMRFEEAERALAWMLGKRIWAYSPIVHCHQLSIRNALPPNHEFWFEYDCAMIRASEGVAVLQIDGWEQSKGVRAELDFAAGICLPVTRVFPYDGHFGMEALT